MNTINKIMEEALTEPSRIAWSSIVDKYPEMWVFVKNIEMVDDDRIFLCEIVEICDDEHEDAIRLKYLSSNDNITAMRTDSSFNGSMGG